MSDVEKRAILVASNLNNLYFCVTPHCRLFFNFSIMKKQQKRKKIIHKIISSNISKSSTKKSKRNSSNFWIGLGQAKWWDNFSASHKVSEKWKENFRMSQESFEIMY